MYKKVLLFFIPILILVYSFTFAGPFNLVHAQGNGSSNVLCSLFPFLEAVGGDFCQGTGDENRVNNAATGLAGLIRFGLQLVFVGIIIVALYVIIKAAIKYMRSEGVTEKVTEAKKAIQSVFGGLIALFVGIIGIILVISFFNASSAVNVEGGSGVDAIDTFKESLLGTGKGSGTGKSTGTGTGGGSQSQ